MPDTYPPHPEPRREPSAKTPLDFDLAAPAPSRPGRSPHPPSPVRTQPPAPSFAATLPMTLGSAALSVVLEAMYYGWPFAIGLTSMIFVHECGHALAARHYRRSYGGMYFMPFVGALVRSRGRSSGPVEDAWIGIMGPIFGAWAALTFLAFFAVLRLPILLQLAKVSFAINLFNLTPMPPLDGSWITGVFRRVTANGLRIPVVKRAERRLFGALYGGLILLLIAGFAVCEWWGGR